MYWHWKHLPKKETEFKFDMLNSWTNVSLDAVSTALLRNVKLGFTMLSLPIVSW